MDKEELKRSVARATNMGFNRNALTEVATTLESNLLSEVNKEAHQEHLRREIFKGASNNWDMAIKAFTEGRKNYLEKKTLKGYLVLLKTFTQVEGK